MLGAYLRTLRRARGWTQEQLAERANVDQTFISQIENGKAGVSLEYLKRLADGLAVPLGELLGEAGLLEKAPDDEASDVRPLLALLEHDPEVKERLAAMRRREDPEVYQQVVLGLVEAFKAQLRAMAPLRGSRGASERDSVR